MRGRSSPSAFPAGSVSGGIATRGLSRRLNADLRLTSTDEAPCPTGWAIDAGQVTSVTVAVTMGTVQEKRARALFNKAKIITVSAPARDYQEVLAGRADASMTSNLEAANLVKKYKQLQRVPVQEGRSPTPLAMLLPQNDQVWINYVNHWIDLKRERGFFKELEAKWLSGN